MVHTCRCRNWRPLARVLCVCSLVSLLGWAGLHQLLDPKPGGADGVEAEESVHGGPELVSTVQCRKNDTLPGGWCLDDSQVPRFVGREYGSSVDVSYHTYEGHTRCLANKTVVFIGDSRVRYEYMHLASYLKSKAFMKCADQMPFKSPEAGDAAFGECNLIDEKLLPDLGWNKWYEMSTNLLIDETQQSLCDCYRPDPFDPGATFENRYTKRQTPFGEIELIYLQSYINKVRISKQFPPFASYSATPERCRPGYCSPKNRTEVFEGDLKSTLQNVLPLICPPEGECHAFINFGWDYQFGFDKQSELSCAMEEYERDHPDIKLYLITSPEDRWQPARSYFNASKLKCKVKVLDRNTPSKNVPSNWYWDYFHVLSLLNEEFNHQMIKMMCPIGSEGGREVS